MASTKKTPKKETKPGKKQKEAQKIRDLMGCLSNK